MASSMAIRCSQPPILLLSPLFKVRSLQHLNNKTRILPKTLSTSAIPNVYQTTLPPSPPSHSSDQRFYRDDLGNPPPPPSPPPPHHHHHHQSTPQPGNFILNQRTQNQQYPPPNHYNYPNTVYPNQGFAYPNQEGYPQQHQHHRIINGIKIIPSTKTLLRLDLMFGGIMGNPEAQIDGTTESGIPTTEKH
ncbi:hypothetical protein NC652_001902 [Populus alba x Populus x berolinensis]|nr:hypothetical protein NC652_001902 [Populus alba x Populus x berolinensis]